MFFITCPCHFLASIPNTKSTLFVGTYAESMFYLLETFREFMQTLINFKDEMERHFTKKNDDKLNSVFLNFPSNKRDIGKEVHSCIIFKIVVK